ncbi:MAG: bacillithiol biosynthesis deacetylase BshB1 [Firmicutes bacterium]|nr:bacillithiol biosynthesis deacetylase BshB1 [Bacillota bacterium]
MQMDVLAFGSHPDDVEIGIGGTLIKHASLGLRCGIVDLTRGEMGSNGTPEIRRQEALHAAEIMGMAVRDNLGLPDARLRVDEESLRAVIEVIRKYRPRVILGPYWKDKHPDHLRASQLVREAAHLSGLRRYPADGEPYRPPLVCQYFLAIFEEPTFVVDVSDFYERKLAALCAHQSQFGLPRDADWKTLVNDPRFIRMIQARDQYVGSMVQAWYGEGLYLEQKLVVEDLTSLRGLSQDGPAWKAVREGKA